MSRNYNTDVDGKPFDKLIIDKVWEKATVTNDDVKELSRRDKCGAYIYKNEYGKNTERGWEIDHIIPVSQGGTDDLNNLQPLHWINNRHKSDNINLECKKTL